ncbi:Fur family transcriptional regulator [uncultured Oscillibacter sp.]|uniref:Fur family transcriptional regulator n=1 Tax=uncultured Oscillibacter sp. TaxID=876091 RepID=UPI0025D6C0E8|nr:transcriptional repressor [uncultured Oscillibacter sp.]
MSYSTKQQQAVLQCLERRGGESLTAAALAEELRQSGSPVGLATVYRQLEKLEQAGRIHKINTEEGAFYQFCPHRPQPGRDCFLLRCEGCGRIVHLDCSHLQALYRHLETEHHFRIDPRRTVLTGLCQACAGEEDAHGSL